MVKNSPSSKKLIILDLQKYCMEIAVNSPPVSPIINTYVTMINLSKLQNSQLYVTIKLTPDFIWILHLFS